jgi:3-oxoacyl-[acyl-carrier-protein] synthase II
LLFDSTVGNSAAALTALEVKARGPNVTVSEKESSGLHAVATAVDLLREGRAAACLTGAVDAVFETFFKGHDGFAVMSTDRAFSHRLAPFDADRCGFVMGEGGFALWLEPGGARRHGEILGVSMSSAAVPVNAWPDRADPLVRSMRLAIADAGLGPSDVHVVYASANATTALDALEAAALAEVFAGCQPIVTAIKGAVGESGTSGVAACAAALLCGAVGRVPPIAGLVSPAIEAASLRLAIGAMLAPGPIVLVNSFASGGALSSVVLRAGTEV